MANKRQASRNTRTPSRAETAPHLDLSESPHHALVAEVQERRRESLVKIKGATEEQQRIDVALRGLVVMARAEGQTWDAIAAALQIPRGTAFARYSAVVSAAQPEPSEHVAAARGRRTWSVPGGRAS